MGGQEHQHHPHNGPHGVGLEVGKVAAHLSRARPGKVTCRRCVDVLKAPARHHGVVAGDERAGYHAHVAHKGQRRAPAEHAEGTRRVCLGAPPDYELGHHARHAQQKHATNIYQHESRTAVLAGQVGETPHVAKPHRRARRGEDDAQLASEFSSF